MGVLRPQRYPEDVGYLFTHPSSLIMFPYFLKTYVLFGYGVVLRPKPTTRLYLSSDAPQILRVVSSLPLGRELASGLHVTALTAESTRVDTH